MESNNQQGQISNESPSNSCSKKYDPPGICLTTPKIKKFYNMNHPSRGRALIFNHSEWEPKSVMGGKRTPYPRRDGSNKDSANLKRCLCWLGFNESDVTVHNNYSLEKISARLSKVSKQNHTESDCLLICVMTHGENGKLVDSEGTCYHLDKLWSHFTPKKCPPLVGKPKLFLIQACRGANPYSTFVDIRMDNQPSACFSYTIPSMADFLIAFSTTEDSVSWRCPQNGSWFIQSICQMLCEYPKEDFLSILTIASRKVAVNYTACLCENDCSSENIHKCPKRIKQVPQLLSTLMRKVQFEPVDDQCPPIDVTHASTGGDSGDFPLHYLPMPVSKDAEYYNMKHSRRGAAIIFYNHKWSSKSWGNLPGYTVDQKNLVDELNRLKFDVREPYENPSVFDIDDVLQAVSEEDHSQNDMLLVAVMTHGNQGDLIDCDGVRYTTERLWKRFSACETLKGKPKIFLIQACRGNQDDPGTDSPKVQSDLGSLTYTLPSDSDFLMVYSSVEDFTSCVMQENGSVFIQSICDAFSKCSNGMNFANESRDLMSVLTEASMNVGLADICFCSTVCPVSNRDQCSTKVKQMPQIVSTLIRKIKFENKTD